MATTTALAELEQLLGEALSTDEVVRENHRYDWAREPGAGLPLAVVQVRTAADVQAALRWATAHDVPVVPRGAGTRLSGGSSPLPLACGTRPIRRHTRSAPSAATSPPTPVACAASSTE